MEGRAPDRGLDRDRTCSQEVSQMIDSIVGVSTDREYLKDIEM